MRYMRISLVVLVLGFCFAGCLGGAIFVYDTLTIFCIPPDETTNSSDYPELLRRWKAKGLVEHFPERIPDDATNIRLSSFPGFLQGGGHFHLQLELPDREIARLFQLHAPQAMKQLEGGQKQEHMNKFKIMSTHFHTSDAGDVSRSFPVDYTLLVLGNSGGWNHGTSHGIAISKQRQQVVFWADHW